MNDKMTITERINSINFDDMTQEDFDFLVDRALKSVRKGSGVKKESKAHKENVKFADQVVALAGDKGYVTVNEVQKALGLENSQKALAIVQAAGFVKNGEVVAGKSEWVKG